jgi:ethanolamine ammonia-lyase small subunit
VQVPVLLRPLLDGLAAAGVSVGQPMLARYGRVKLAEAISDAVQAEVILILIVRCRLSSVR